MTLGNCQRLDNLEKRADKFDNNVEKLTEAVHKISLSLAEITSTHKTINRLFDEIAELKRTVHQSDSRLQAVEAKIPMLIETRDHILKIVATIIVAVVLAVLGLVLK